jgi:GTP1/Obg family GTP-binding protein
MNATAPVINDKELLDSDASSDARNQIISCLDRWRQLTRLEGQAIHRNEWAEVRKIQAIKSNFQRPLQTLLDQWKNSEAGRMENIEPFYLKTVEELLALENQNLESISARKQAAAERKKLSEQAARNLRMIRDSYAGKLDNGWQVYS